MCFLDTTTVILSQQSTNARSLSCSSRGITKNDIAGSTVGIVRDDLHVKEFEVMIVVVNQRMQM